MAPYAALAGRQSRGRRDMPACSHCLLVEFFGVLGKEGLALRKEVARLVRAMAGIEWDAERAIALAGQRAEAARSESAADAAAASRAGMSHFGDKAQRLEAALADAEQLRAGPRARILSRTREGYPVSIAPCRAATLVVAC